MESLLETGAFANPVLDSQRVFRAIMDALANPGTLRVLALELPPQPPLTGELAALLLTLCDHDSPVWLDERLGGSAAVRDWLRFHTGAPLAAGPQTAAFAFALDAVDLPPLAAFAPGTDQYPDRSTTIVLQLTNLSGGPALSLRGPGIRDRIGIAPQGLPPDFVSQWAENRDRFPRGVDVVLCSPAGLIGLPRTTRIEEDR